MFTGPKYITDGLVFGTDTGYPAVSESHHKYKYNLGEPTSTFNIGTMVPTNPTTYFTSSHTYHSNMHGTVWDWTYYPDSNIHADGGMEWIPSYPGPTFKGAWKMKQRPGGNSESNFSGTAPGTISQTSAYTVSVWCKTTTASTFRIHLNTTKDGSSYWGYASSYHSGGGDWERLSVTIPANAGNTSINTIRCQGTGNNKTADAYWRDYQVEQNPHATPFIPLSGSDNIRSSANSLVDLTRTYTINTANVSYDSQAQVDFDGTGDHLLLGDGSDITFKSNGGNWTVESIVKYDSVPAGYNNSTSPGNFIGASGISYNSWYWSVLNSKLALWNMSPGTWKYGSTTLVADRYYHAVLVCETGGTTYRMYLNGVEEGGTHSGYSFNASYSGLKIQYIGRGSSGNPRAVNGKIPVTRVYDRALNASEILQNFKAFKKRFDM